MNEALMVSFGGKLLKILINSEMLLNPALITCVLLFKICIHEFESVLFSIALLIYLNACLNRTH